jgi:hypothetical protein
MKRSLCSFLILFGLPLSLTAEANPRTESLTVFVPFLKAAVLGLLALVTVLLLWPRPLAAAPIPVRFPEGLTHGFLVLSTKDGVFLASGDLLQAARDGAVESRMVFRFKDGSVFDETAVFTQEQKFTLQSYHLVQSGPAFPEDTEISLQRASGKYRIKTKTHKDGREEVLEGKLDLPPDVYNGMVVTVTKNLGKGVGETVHIVAFTPKPLLIKLKLVPAGEHKVLVGERAKTATHFVFEPKPGMWLTLFAKLLGRMPPDYHVWVVTDDLPAFVRFDGPLYSMGPIWRIELTSPRLPD